MNFFRFLTWPRNATGGLGRFFARGAPVGSETTRPRGKPFDDPGGYAAHGDWPFVPSDLLKIRSHNDNGDRP